MITASPESYIGITGEPVALHCVARGFPAPDITWLRNGETVNGSSIDITSSVILALTSTSNLTILSLQPLDAGNYTCIASSSLASLQLAESQKGILTVHGIQESFSYPGSSHDK